MGTVIFEDTRQQVNHGDKHAFKHEWFESHGVQVERKKLDFGDYATDGSNVVVDTKRGLAELCANLCGKANEHNRVRREMERARDAGYRLVFLVETSKIKDLDGVRSWTHSHCTHCRFYNAKKCDPHDARGTCAKHGTRKPAQGERLAKTMGTMAARYGCRFEFAHPRKSAERICELLGVRYVG